LTLEARLRQALQIEELPPLSIAEIISLLFGMFGHQNVLGGFGATMAAIHKTIGTDLLWKVPEKSIDVTLVQ
jgi:hypothetical protein